LGVLGRGKTICEVRSVIGGQGVGELEVAVGGWGVDGGGGKCGSNEWERDGMRWLLKGERAHNLLNRSAPRR
jgi:hypothetical protein